MKLHNPLPRILAFAAFAISACWVDRNGLAVEHVFTNSTDKLLSGSPRKKNFVSHPFEQDARRHFVGEVESYEHGIARATGFVFVVDDLNKHLFVKRHDRRTKLIPIASGEVILNVIPEGVDLARVRYELEQRSLVVTDGKAWRIDVKEFGWS